MLEFWIHDWKLVSGLAMHLFSTACKMAFFMIVKVTDASSRENKVKNKEKILVQ